MYLTYSYEVEALSTSDLYPDIITLYILGREGTYCYFTIWSSWNWEQGLVRPAPALCWGRATGIISKIWYPPGFRPTARARTVPGCQESLPVDSPRLIFRGCIKTDIILRQLKKNKNLKVWEGKIFSMSLGLHLQSYENKVPFRASNYVINIAYYNYSTMVHNKNRIQSWSCVIWYMIHFWVFGYNFQTSEWAAHKIPPLEQKL